MSFDDEAVQRYEIERIVSKRTTQQGFTEYYIKWKDYNDDENTWEPLENLIEDKASLYTDSSDSSIYPLSSQALTTS